MKPMAVYGQELVAEDPLGLHSAMEVDMDGDSLDWLTDKLTSFRRLLLPVQVKSSYYHD